MKQQLETASISGRIRSLMGSDSETAFGQRLSIHPGLLSTYLRGQVPAPAALARISDMCHVTVDWLLRGPASEASPPAPPKNGAPDSDRRAVPPPVNLVLSHPALAAVRSAVSDPLLIQIVREEIQRWAKAKTGAGPDPMTEIAHRAAHQAQALFLPRRDYVNATGIIIHTGWGNAPLHPAARQRVTAATGASPTGAAEALPRMETCARFLRTLTGAEAATITTGNAASLLLIAGALAAGREIIVAARDLVEISQGARIADILQAAGARVISVGSANCVYAADYERAINPQTAILLRVRVANMATSGYIAHVSGPDLAQLAKKHNLIYIDNLGGGSLVDLTKKDIPECPTLQQGISDGAHLVLASGDKIIGGPQAGIIVGTKEHISRVSRHVLARTCRPAKLTLAALEATFAIYIAGRAWEEMPTLRLLATPVGELSRRAGIMAKAASAGGLQASACADTTECGGAVLPGVLLPTWTVQLAHPKLTEDHLYDVLMARGVIARRALGKVILDFRSVAPDDDSLLFDAVVDSLSSAAA